MWNDDMKRAANFLASMPMGNTVLDAKDLKAMLLETGGCMLACGRLYNIKSEHIGVGVHKVWLEIWNP